MKNILKPEEWVLKLYPEQTQKECKLSNFIIVEEYDDEILLFHTITWAIYVLTKEEYENILENEELKTFFVIIDKNLDELSIAENVYKERIVKKVLPSYEYISSFVILTTTSCNARCNYCYEKGLVEIDTMTTETAEKVFNFMIEHKYPNNPINIQWFGGEPLLNTRVMDYISNKLKESEIAYESTIISNGYLFNSENIIKAKELWKVKNCQITIDGIFEKYNEIKNFVYSDVDAFLVLIDNMKKILNESDITITVRLNIGNENIFQMYDTISYLKEEFKEEANQGKISFYAYKLFDISEGREKEVDGFNEEIEKIKTVITLNNADKCDVFTGNETYKRTPIFNMCMAYNATGIAILPNGTFSPCEHIKEEDLFGNVTDGIIDTSIIERWQTFDGEPINYCRQQNCPLHPLCPRFYNCPNSVICDEKNLKINERLNEAHKRLKNTYTYYKTELKKRKVGN